MLHRFFHNKLAIIFSMTVIGIVSGIGLVVGYSFAPEVKNSFTPIPEKFTELYFENHLDLPKIMKPDEEQDFSFTIHNLEHTQMNYVVSLTAEPELTPDNSFLIDQVAVPLEHDQSETIQQTFKLPELMSQRVKVTVQLLYLDQTIHFWVDLDGLEATPEASPSDELLIFPT